MQWVRGDVRSGKEASAVVVGGVLGWEEEWRRGVRSEGMYDRL